MAEETECEDDVHAVSCAAVTLSRPTRRTAWHSPETQIELLSGQLLTVRVVAGVEQAHRDPLDKMVRPLPVSPEV